MNSPNALFLALFAAATATVGVVHEVAPAPSTCSVEVKQADKPAKVVFYSPDEAVMHASWDAFAD